MTSTCYSKLLSGKPCSYKAKINGLCGIHAKKSGGAVTRSGKSTDGVSLPPKNLRLVKPKPLELKTIQEPSMLRPTVKRHKTKKQELTLVKDTFERTTVNTRKKATTPTTKTKAEKNKDKKLRLKANQKSRKNLNTPPSPVRESEGAKNLNDLISELSISKTEKRRLFRQKKKEDLTLVKDRKDLEKKALLEHKELEKKNKKLEQELAERDRKAKIDRKLENRAERDRKSKRDRKLEKELSERDRKTRRDIKLEKLKRDRKTKNRAERGIVKNVLPQLDLFYKILPHNGSKTVMGVNEHNMTLDFNVDLLRKHIHDFEKLKDIILQILDKETKRIIKTDNLKRKDRLAIIIAKGKKYYVATLEEFNLQDFLNNHAASLQSWLNNHMDENLEITISTIKMPSGGGVNMNTTLLPITAKDLMKKRSLVYVNNPKNEMCGAIAALLGAAYQNKDTNIKYWKKINDSKGKEQTKKAEELYEQIGKQYDEICTIDDFQNIETVLGVQIIILDSAQKNKQVYKGDKIDGKQPIFLYQFENHYHLITSVSGLLATSGYCVDCDLGYKRHTCPFQEKSIKCSLCQTVDIDHVTRKMNDENKKYNVWITCQDCNRIFPDDDCFQAHTTNICKEKYKCDMCDRTFIEKEFPRDTHLCGQFKCPNCEYVVEEGHQCFMKKIDTNIDEEHKYYFYDFESMVLKVSYEHVVNYAVLHNESGFLRAFKNIDEFCSFAFDNNHRNTTWLAHNAKGYDAIFIHNWLIKHNLIPHIIYAGSKIMQMSIQKLKIRFIDSMNFIAGKLAGFTKQFGLSELKKGYFPHLFNTPENQTYSGPYPDVSYYSPDKMMREHKPKCSGCRECFLKWYNDKIENKAVFDFKKEMHDYCNSDVDLLRNGIMSFRKNFMDLTNIDPLQCVTIASAVMKSYRHQDLRDEKTIPIVYNDRINRDQHSKKAITWLDYVADKQNIKIMHAKNGGEKLVCGRKVDGFCEENQTVYQFHGCFWHGCKLCNPSGWAKNPVNHKTFSELAKDTDKFDRKLAKYFQVVTVWEHDFDKDENLTKWVEDKKYKYSTVMNPREAFMGGRTNASSLYYKCGPNEKIRYVDFTSLYPTINKYGIYPTVHPEIITPLSGETDISTYQGLIKCIVLPPKNLFHPVLPLKQGLKLVFGLCQTCITHKSSNCSHTVEERCLSGTWTHLELSKALDKGYKIIQIDEVHHFSKFEEGLYADFVNKWLKIKQEASGFPEGVVTEQDKDGYITDYFTHEGVRLNKMDIAKNPGRRATAKIILNSFWGKLGQRENLEKVVFFDTPEKLYRCLNDKELNILGWKIVHNECVAVTFKDKRNFVQPAKNTNVYHAIFTTSQARLKLYDLLEKLDERVLYYDTDSVIYVEDENCPEVQLGNYLGDLTDEVEDKDDYIIEYASGGPKNYAYKLNSGKVVAKVKGFCLNYECSEKINMQSMIKLILAAKSGKCETINVPVMMFNLDKFKAEIKTNNTTKKYQFEFDTRFIEWDSFKTYPFGYEQAQ